VYCATKENANKLVDAANHLQSRQYVKSDCRDKTCYDLRACSYAPLSFYENEKKGEYEVIDFDRIKFVKSDFDDVLEVSKIIKKMKEYELVYRINLLKIFVVCLYIFDCNFESYSDFIGYR
jgi:hypothetical protein